MSSAVLRRADIAVDFPATEPRAVPRQGLSIATRNLQKSFGDHRVLRGIDLDVAAGQFVAIVGRSGCGKSTLLRLLLGLETPTGGSFAFRDGTQAVHDRSVARVMFQEPRLLPWASVLANVEVGLGRER
jgi:sulfonate transport system ATP-binding protein